MFEFSNGPKPKKPPQWVINQHKKDQLEKRKRAAKMRHLGRNLPSNWWLDIKYGNTTSNLIPLPEDGSGFLQTLAIGLFTLWIVGQIIGPFL
ncbi:hypothetical protein [uncultured Lactobacillus sp.]|uniref:hypothetical protein n=1 Tax=uncultured Lactobacillus sp. TaxID=153152 RepID=UPI0023D09CAB|nr:hypothetical protein [uncultured Lactobacillus sp.]MDE7056139.1 hypothetical protein [Lactobacillus sp.]